MTNSPQLLGVVLCGGKSSRMGRDKSFLQHADGTTYLQHAVRRIAVVCDAVGISCHQRIETEHHLILDPIAYQGPAVGIAASLRFAKQNSFAACLFTPVDMPHLTDSDLRAIKQIWQRSNGLTVAHAQQLQPLVAVYPVSLLGKIEQLAASADRSLMNWMKSENYATAGIPAAACHNVNTPQDLFDGP